MKPPRRNLEAWVSERKCDLCADRNVQDWWRAKVLGGLRIPESSWDPVTGQLIDTIFPEDNEWGVCGPCKAACDLFADPVTMEYLVAHTDICRRFGENTAADRIPEEAALLLSRMINLVARGPRTPWIASDPPPVRQVSRRWIQ